MRLANVEILFACCLALPALAGRRRTQLMPRDYRGVQTIIGGIFVTPVPNFPFSADVEIVSHIKTTDGSEHVVTTTEHIARASSGRIYNERRVFVPAGFKGTPRLLGFLHLRSIQQAKHPRQSDAASGPRDHAARALANSSQHRSLRSNSPSCPASPKPIWERNR